jgi:hypothetical protein
MGSEPRQGPTPQSRACMGTEIRIGIVSDIHYASAAEQARGDHYETAGLRNPLLKLFVRSYRRFVWLHEPFKKNYLLDRFLAQAPGFDYVVANGDYSCDSAYLGLSDDAACQSARECLQKLRAAFGDRLLINFGDHELGKLSLFGGRGGMRLASWHRALDQLSLQPFWQVPVGNYVILGIVSSLVALPVFEADLLNEERAGWDALRAEHLGKIRGAFAALRPDQRVLLFCHDPTALPFLWREPVVQARTAQIEQTIIGHLHSNLILWKSRRLAGLPRITFLGHTAKRLSSALREARYWKPFRVRLCPSLAGIELLKDGGYLTATLDPGIARPARFEFSAVARK